jgi:DNA-binding transcriptional LysR family regulator
MHVPSCIWQVELRDISICFSDETGTLPHVDVRQLAAIVAVADHGTFSAAARALYTVQSNVSGHVAKLERELGVTLIDRASGGLTDEGERVVERARRVLHEIDDIAADIASLDDDIAGDARIGVIGTTARWLMPQLLGAVAERYPRVHPIVSEGSTTTIVPGVLAGQLNAAIIHLPIDDPELDVEPLFAEDLLVLAPRAHPLAARETMSLAELDQVPLLLPPKGAALRRVLDRAAAAANVTLVAQAEIDGVRLLASLVFDGSRATSSASPCPSCHGASSPGFGAAARARAQRPRPSPAHWSTWCVRTPTSSRASTSAATHSPSRDPDRDAGHGGANVTAARTSR